MTRDTRTVAQRNRAVRQEAIREQLASQQHIHHVVEILDKIHDVATPMDPEHLARYKVVLDGKFKLIGKYLPDLKATEITAEVNGDMVHKTTIEFVSAKPQNTDT